MKKVPLSVRIDPDLKAAAEKVAALEHRSITNLIETLLLERCQKHKIKAGERAK
jgi:hypothetical protein